MTSLLSNALGSTLTKPVEVSPGIGLTPADLADLMSSFNDVTSKLEATHVRLRDEVRRLTDELADANEQLERSRRLAALGEMAAGIAHEIRNPLGSIGLYARLLVEDLEDVPAPKQTATKIAGAVRRLDAIVCDVLAFSRELRVRPQPVEAGMLFDDAIESCAADMKRWLGEDFEVTLDGADLTVVCDIGLAQQALVNLVRNACEAMAAADERPELRLSARAVTGGEGRRAAAIVSVSDGGPGIPREVIDRIFNPFFTTRETGTGLGLAIVHRIADAHGGWVEVFNNVERGGARGATVELCLPYPHHATTSVAATDASASETETGRRASA